MAKSNSPLGQYPASIPAGADPPTIQPDLAALVTAIEKTANMIFASRAARDAVITSPVDGMVTQIGGSVNEVDRRINGVWVKIWPNIYSGTAAPASGLGVVGDIYAQYT